MFSLSKNDHIEVSKVAVLHNLEKIILTWSVHQRIPHTTLGSLPHTTFGSMVENTRGCKFKRQRSNYRNCITTKIYRCHHVSGNEDRKIEKNRQEVTDTEKKQFMHK